MFQVSISISQAVEKYCCYPNTQVITDTNEMCVMATLRIINDNASNNEWEQDCPS